MKVDTRCPLLLITDDFVFALPARNDAILLDVERNQKVSSRTLNNLQGVSHGTIFILEKSRNMHHVRRITFLTPTMIWTGMLNYL